MLSISSDEENSDFEETNSALASGHTFHKSVLKEHFT